MAPIVICRAAAAAGGRHVRCYATGDVAVHTFWALKLCVAVEHCGGQTLPARRTVPSAAKLVVLLLLLWTFLRLLLKRFSRWPLQPFYLPTSTPSIFVYFFLSFLLALPSYPFSSIICFRSPLAPHATHLDRPTSSRSRSSPCMTRFNPIVIFVQRSLYHTTTSPRTPVRFRRCCSRETHLYREDVVG